MITGIIGAGPSGLALAQFLKEPYEILEAESHVGGHASSFTKDGFTFDYGPHILFSRDQEILDFIVRSLGDNVHRCPRNNKVSFKNRLVKYPFENDLKSLPPEDCFECLYAFVYNPYKEKFAQPTNLKEWLLKTFGEGICQRYLFPYNQKVWNLPVEELSMLWADRIPNPPPADVIRSAIGFETEGYTHQLYYHYPKRGGYQAISESWARHAKVRLGARISRISKQGDEFVVSDGSRKWSYSRLVSTAPIHQLIEMVDFEIPSSVQEAVAALLVNPMFIVSLGIRGEDEKKLTAIYFPEEEFLVNRVSFPCTFSPENGPSGYYSIQAEITCRRDSDIWRWTDDRILEHVIGGLTKRGIISGREAVSLTDVRRKEYSYVVYDRAYLRNTALVRDFFQSHGIHLLGRFGYFEYINVDQAVARALETAAELNGEDKSQNRAPYLENAKMRFIQR